MELIENNGTELKKCVEKYIELWKLPLEFSQWVTKCSFSNTLVDRIVTGYPKKDIDAFTEKLGYTDNLLDTAEPFFFWAIEDAEGLKDAFPAHESGLGAIFCDDISGYKMRKVRILNGAHTVSVLGAYLAGFDIVRDMMNDDKSNSFIPKLVPLSFTFPIFSPSLIIPILKVTFIFPFCNNSKNFSNDFNL